LGYRKLSIKTTMNVKKRKLLVAFSSFGPRHRAKAAILKARDPEAVFLEIAGSSNIYFWEPSSNDLPIELIRLFPSSKMEELSELKIMPKIFKILNEINPAVVMYHGLLEPGFRTMAIWSKLKQVHGILHFDSWYDNRSRLSWKQYLKGNIYKFFYKYAFVAGKNSKDYLISMGYPEQNIVVGCDVVDNHYFTEKSNNLINQATMRDREELPENYFLAVARYSPEKDHRTLLEAYRKYLDQGSDWKLVLIGEGPLKEQIRDQINSLNLGDQVIQKGWISYATIPIYYTYARCLILPSSSEPWGLVANEAAACGLPLILSNKCGCVPELCIPGLNGFVFESGDAEKLSKCMSKMSNGSVDLRAFGEKSRELVAPYTLESWALKVLEIKNLILGNKAKE
jgi:1,2-diacylglycerol 3-alpha-glucosyltransferase